MFTVQDIQCKLPFQLLNGETISYDNLLEDDLSGRIIVSTFRLFAQPSQGSGCFYNMPLSLIEHYEKPDQKILKIHCRHGYGFSLRFPTLTRAIEAYNICIAASGRTFQPTEIEIGRTVVPFPSQISNCLCDYKRLKLDYGAFRITTANLNHRICGTYPEYCVVPSEIDNSDIINAASFRLNNRFIAITYKHQVNGVCIARCAQPAIGIMCSRSTQDERIIRALGKTVPSSGEDNSGNETSAQRRVELNIVDARHGKSAYFNRAKGGGYEYEQYYVGSKIHFMDIPNIHSVRSAFDALRELIIGPAFSDVSSLRDQFRQLEWPKYISLIIKSAYFIVNSVHYDGIPVLVHCSDGWDRTPQLVSLAKLCLDPYYRTSKGFCVLVEMEWLAFGHQFCMRCRSGHDSKERSPVFIQFLDCVNQLLAMYPSCFEFNTYFLTKIAIHCYTTLFSTFSPLAEPPALVESTRCLTRNGRIDINGEMDFTNGANEDLIHVYISDRPAKLSPTISKMSLWSFLLGNEEFENPYFKSDDPYKVLLPRIEDHSVVFWEDLFLHGCWTKSDHKMTLVDPGLVNPVTETDDPSGREMEKLIESVHSQEHASESKSIISIDDNVRPGIDEEANGGSPSSGARPDPASIRRRRRSDSFLMSADSPSGSCNTDTSNEGKSSFELLDPEAFMISKSNPCLSDISSGVDHKLEARARDTYKLLSKSIISLLRLSMDYEPLNKLHSKLIDLQGREPPRLETKGRKLPIDVDGLISARVKENNSREILFLRKRNEVLESALTSFADFLRSSLINRHSESGLEEDEMAGCDTENSNVEEDKKDRRRRVHASNPSNECSQCSSRLRWMIKPKQRCKLCSQFFCKTCCDTVVTLVPRYFLRDRPSIGEVLSSPTTPSRSMPRPEGGPVFRICDQCATLHLGKLMSLVNL